MRKILNTPKPDWKIQSPEKVREFSKPDAAWSIPVCKLCGYAMVRVA